MNINTIDIGFISIAIIVPFVFIGISLFIFSMYYLFHQKIKTNVIFDISLLMIVSGFLLSRIVGFIDNYRDYNNVGWSITPLSDDQNSIFFNHKLPWEFLNFFDGNFFIIGLPLGAVFGALVLYLASNKAKGMNYFIDNITFAVFPMHFVFLIGALVGQLYYGKVNSSFLSLPIVNEPERMLSIILIELIILILVLVFGSAISKILKKSGLFAFCYLLSQSLILIFFLPLSIQSNNDYLLWVFGGLNLFVSLIVFWHFISEMRSASKKIQKIQNEVIEEKQLQGINQPAYSDIEVAKIQNKGKIGRIFRWKRKN